MTPWFWMWPDGRSTWIFPISGGDGDGGTETTILQQAPRSAEEETLLAAQAELLTLQIEDIQRQNAALGELFPSQQALLVAQTQAALEQVGLFHQIITELAPTPDERRIRDVSAKRALALLTGEAPTLSPEQQANLETIYGTARKRGTEELTRFGEEIAASRGMRLTDTPIGAEVLREKSRFEENLAAARATAELDYGQTNRAFDESVRQFQENLRMTAFQNRLALLGREPSATQPILSSGGLPLSTFSAVSPLVATLQAGRNQGQTQRFQPGGYNYAALGAQTAGLALGGYLGAGGRFGLR